VVLRSLNDAMRRALEQELKMQPGKYEHQSDFARTYFGQGEAKGRAEGEIKGEIKGETKALLAVLEARGMTLDPSTRERIEGCMDAEQLQRWIVRAATASSIEEVFGTP
jgi:hypothetical protein